MFPPCIPDIDAMGLPCLRGKHRKFRKQIARLRGGIRFTMKQLHSETFREIEKRPKLLTALSCRGALKLERLKIYDTKLEAIIDTKNKHSNAKTASFISHLVDFVIAKSFPVLNLLILN